jgi:hypothetical protein
MRDLERARRHPGPIELSRQLRQVRLLLTAGLQAARGEVVVHD